MLYSVGEQQLINQLGGTEQIPWQEHWSTLSEVVLPGGGDDVADDDEPPGRGDTAGNVGALERARSQGIGLMGGGGGGSGDGSPAHDLSPGQRASQLQQEEDEKYERMAANLSALTSVERMMYEGWREAKAAEAAYKARVAAKKAQQAGGSGTTAPNASWRLPRPGCGRAWRRRRRRWRRPGRCGIHSEASIGAVSAVPAVDRRGDQRQPSKPAHWAPSSSDRKERIEQRHAAAEYARRHAARCRREGPMLRALSLGAHTRGGAEGVVLFLFMRPEDAPLRKMYASSMRPFVSSLQGTGLQIAKVIEASNARGPREGLMRNSMSGERSRRTRGAHAYDAWPSPPHTTVPTLYLLCNCATSDMACGA